MGELSKKIGEKGEKLVTNFLSLLGWDDLPDGKSISCHHPEKHKRTEKNRTTHGIDLFYSAKSQVQDFTLDNVVISVKYTSNAYPNSPASKFKEHLKDLAQTVECFMNSDLRAESNEEYEFTGITNVNDTGVLMWLTNHKDSDQDIVKKISNINLDRDLSFSSIQVVDNARAAFIYDAISFVKAKYSNSDVYFHYAFSSVNYKDPGIEKYGAIFPVEYLTSDVIPFRVIDPDTNHVTFCLSTRDNFSENSLNRLLYLASDVSQKFTGDFALLFPDYDTLEHESIVKKAKRTHSKSQNKTSITVHSYGNDFRNLINE
ncbi:MULTISPECIES: hypothetical protein [Shewanella]|uniref:GapS4a family protein n=1 Tax=Shewanella TaxID=22 RepID=UPI001CF9CE48|nr:hypothetical protein [Shewanella chilikensis]MCE9853496.1 hypothetical protein [Shewanella chilikensis]